MSDIKKGIVGIRARPDSKYTFAGTGFIVHGSLILTCAHVVRQADDRDNKWRFQVEGDKHILTATLTKIDEHLDIAILTPTQPLKDVASLKLLKSDQSHKHEFSTFGYPQQGNYDGLNGAGRILDWATDKQNRLALQFESTQVTHGFSGSPLWDDALQAVVGMVSSGFDFGLDKKLGNVGFAIPCEVLKEFFPALVVGEPPPPPPPLTWNLKHPYGMPPNFTGRVPEQAALTDWLIDDPDHPLLIVRALGGFGKSALAWHWLTHEVDNARWPYVLWWSFYEGDASFDGFLSETLRYLLGEKVELPTGPRLQAERLRDELCRRNNVLLILDGFERVLRAFQGMNAAYQGDDETREQGYNERDCVAPAAEGFLHDLTSLGGLVKSKVLMTTRLRPRIVERYGALLTGCIEKELTALAPADAVEFFQRQGIRGTYTEIEAACVPYGYHPLSLRLLAGVIANDFKTPSDIRAAQDLNVSGDVKQRQRHVLEVAYNSLSAAKKTALSLVACFRAMVAYDALKAISDLSEKDLGVILHDLITRGLLQRIKDDVASTKFGLHPIVRRYAYERLTDKIAVHNRVRDYFANIEIPAELQTLDELTPLIELYHHTVCAEQYDEAFTLFRGRINKIIWYQFSMNQQMIELLRALFPDGEDKPPRLKNETDQEWPLGELANSYSYNGQPSRAVTLYKHANIINEKSGDKKNFAIGLGNLASMAQLHIGELRQAEDNLRLSIQLCREIDDEFLRAVEYNNLGRLLAFRGAWGEAAEYLTSSLFLLKKQHEVQSVGIVWADLALRALMMQNVAEALAAARRALEMADETAQTYYPHEHDYVVAHWLLGAAHGANGNLVEAELHLTESLTRCRGINLVESEGNILVDLARLRVAQGNLEEAEHLADEALEITERSHYVLQSADVHLELAKLAWLYGKKDAVLEHAREALRLATCDGEPYVYRVAYDEAQALVRKLEAKA